VRILELSLRNYRVFEEVDLELPAKAIGIFGENGSGKTTLMESIGFACFGVDASRTKKQEIRTEGLLTDCEVRMAFEHGGRQYEVRRLLRGKGSSPEAELYAGDLQLAAGVTDVDAEIRRLLHMDLHVFRASVFAEQKQLDALSSMRPGERKAMALRLLGIKPVEEARFAARREAKATKQSAEQLSDAIVDVAELEAAVKEAKDLVLEAERALKSAAADLKEATRAHAESLKAFQASDAARQRVEKLLVELNAANEAHERTRERRDGWVERIAELTEALGELPGLEGELEGLVGSDDLLQAAERLTQARNVAAGLERSLAELPPGELEPAATAVRAAEQALAAAQQQAAKAAAAADHAERRVGDAEERLSRAEGADPSEPCPSCGRPLGEDFAGYVKHCRAEVAAAKRARTQAAEEAREGEHDRADAEKAVLGARASEAAARDAERARSDLERRLKETRAQEAELARPFEREEVDLRTLRSRVSRARELRDRVSELRAEGKHLARAQADLEKEEADLARLGARLQSLSEEAEQVAFDPEAHEQAGAALEEAEARLEGVRETERAAATATAEAREEAGRLEGELKQARETAARVDDLRSEGRHVERVAILLDGFRDHLVARVGPELSREAEALFRELTTNAYDDLRIDEETLNIQIADGDSYHAIDRFSGSETDLANLALRIAISTHLSRVSGADVGLMVLDEVLASLDEERKDLLVQTLGRLAGRFHQLFVVTHAERVKDQFPAVVQVRKTGRRRSEAVLV
jgi:exonuclease SbcC